MKLSIIVPVYNEEKTLTEIIKRVRKAKLPKDLEKEIVIVNDGSSDCTKNILAKIKADKKTKIISHPTNLGKGAVIRTGLGQTAGEIFLIQDADLEYYPRDYPKLLKPILPGKTKVVYGSRLMRLKFKPFGQIFFLLVYLLIWPNIRDKMSLINHAFRTVSTICPNQFSTNKLTVGFQEKLLTRLILLKHKFFLLQATSDNNQDKKHKSFYSLLD